MKFSLVLLAAGALAAPKPEPRQATDVRDMPIVRQGSALLLDGKQWKAVGPNAYWLGLDNNPNEAVSYPSKGRITEIMAQVKAMGGTAIRSHTLGVNCGHALSVMPKQGTVNAKAFDTIDWAVNEARAYGLRLLVPLTDNWDYYHGGKYTFLRWAGINASQGSSQMQQFYTNNAVITMFKDYITTILTHVNQYNNISYANDPTIFAYETGNELEGPSSRDLNVPTAWLTQIAQHIKSLAPKKLVLDGTYGVNRDHLNIPEVDIFSNHGYPVSIFKTNSDLALVATANKTYFAGEYTWNSNSGGDAALDGFFAALEASQNYAGDMFWSMFGHNVPDCKTFMNHNDGLTLQLGNPANSAFTNSRIQMIHRHYVKVTQGTDIGANAALPVVACPAPDTPTL